EISAHPPLYFLRVYLLIQKVVYLSHSHVPVRKQHCEIDHSADDQPFDGLGIAAPATHVHKPFQLHIETSTLKAVRTRPKPTVISLRNRIGICNDAPRNLFSQDFRGAAGCTVAEAAQVLFQPVPPDELPGPASRSTHTAPSAQDEARSDEDDIPRTIQLA